MAFGCLNVQLDLRMLSSDEPSNTDVDELLESWINATAPEAPEAAAGLGSTALSPAHAPPRVSGLLQGASLRDINPPLTSAANAGARLTNHPGATEAAKASSQVIGPSTNLDPEQELKAKRGKHTVDGVPDSAPRNSEVNRRAQKKFRAKQKVCLALSCQHTSVTNAQVFCVLAY